MNKRIIAFVIVVLMIFSLQVNTLADSILDDALFDVSALELMIPDDNGSYNTDKSLTRAEFATALLRLIGYNEVYAEPTKFVDVNKNDWFYSSVASISALGIMTGDGNGYFRPNDPVTMPEALKTFVCVLGYDTDAKLKGGYPNGYISTASKIGVTKNVGVNTNLTRREFAIMLYNSLDIKLLEPMYGSDKLYKSGETYRLIIMRRRGENIYNLMGVVEANSFSYTRYPISDLEEDEVVINGVRFHKGNSNVDQYLGMDVEVFAVQRESGRLDILTVRPTIKNNISIVNNSNITGSFQNSVTYRDDKGKQELSYENFPCMLYNGTPIDFDENELLNLGCGEVKFIDCNNNNLVDYIFIEEAENMLVERVSGNVIVSQGGFSVKGRSTLFIDYNNRDKKFEIFSSTKELVGFDEIKENQLISVMVDRKETRYRIYISEQVEKGIISSIGSDYIEINGKEYKTTDATIFDAGLGKNVEIYLDYLCNAIYIKPVTEETNYAYVLATGHEGFSRNQIELVLSSSVSFTSDIDEENVDNITSTPVLLCRNKEIAVFDFAKRVKINGKTYDSDDAKAMLNEGDIIKYSINAEGLFREAEILNPYANETGTALKYDVREKVFGGNQFVSGFGLDETTQIIAVPENPDCDDDWLVLTRVDEAGSNEHGYIAQGFDRIEQTKKAGLTVVTLAMDSEYVKSANLKSSAACMVKDVWFVVDEEDNEFCRITVNEKGEEKTYDTIPLTDDNRVIASLQEGDLISFFMNDEDLIENVFLIRSFKTDGGSYNIDEADRDINNAYKERRGKVETVEFNEISTTEAKTVTVASCDINGTIVPIEIGQRNRPPIYIYDTSADETVRIGSLEEIIPGNDELYVLTIGSEMPRVCVIIR